jgi:serine phosphatase RsbU (regulator of sigma subunit)
MSLVWSSAPLVKRTTERIDRAFFRSAYDARQILENLVEEARTVASREELAVLLGGEIRQALHPGFAAVYLADRDGKLRVYPETGLAKQTLPSRAPLLEELAQRNELWQISDIDPRERGLLNDLAIFAPNPPECLVPILTRGGALTGLLALGARLAEESYSREDQRLLSAVAAQAGVTLENMRLAEDMAERIEAERRIARDMEIAKQVQARLFPQKLPALETLEYAGRCIQARDVGGDYYDFLNLGAGRLGMVLADIAGKGIPGALLIANLQADVRSQCAIASQNLRQFLKSVNQSFFESTDEGRYATLFFGDYQNSTRQLRYANCGHNPPLLVHANGTAERLTPTATVLGLFEEWESSLADVRINSGDVLVIYTDGITEASDSEGEEFGEGRLLETVRCHLAEPVPCILDAILTAALEFSGGHGKMTDDLTLGVARGR